MKNHPFVKLIFSNKINQIKQKKSVLFLERSATKCAESSFYQFSHFIG